MGLHVITSDGRLQKRISTSRFDSRTGTYEVIEGDVFSDFYPGENFRVLKSFDNSEIDEDLLFSILTHTHKNFAILPNRGWVNGFVEKTLYWKTKNALGFK